MMQQSAEYRFCPAAAPTAEEEEAQCIDTESDDDRLLALAGEEQSQPGAGTQQQSGLAERSAEAAPYWDTARKMGSYHHPSREQAANHQGQSSQD